MGRVVAMIGAAVTLAAACQGAEPAGCRIRKGLYEQRLALVSAPHAPGVDGDGPAGNGGSAAVARTSLDREYAEFFRALAKAVESSDPTAILACCKEAAEDRAGTLACQLVTYLAGGRTDSLTFLSAFPTARKDAAALWDLDYIVASAVASGSPVPKAFQPKGPSYRYVDELFLLVLDGKEDAIVKYFNLANFAAAEYARYMDDKLGTLVREAPATLVTNWYLLRKHKARIKAVVQTFVAAASPAETQKVVRAVNSLCAKDDPDCQEILRLFPKK